MEQKYILLTLTSLFILGLGVYWLIQKRLTPNHYFSANAAELARENTNYRHVLYTTPKSQLTLMAIPTGKEIPKETHDVDQVFIIVEGTAEALVETSKVPLTKESVLIIPAGTEHSILNTGPIELKLYTIYAPPEHPAGTIHKTIEDELKDH